MSMQIVLIFVHLSYFPKISGVGIRNLLRVGNTYLKNALFPIFHCTSLALAVIYCR